MSGELSPIDKAKYVAAKRSVDYVEDGMRVGLGTGLPPPGWCAASVSWFARTG